MTPAESTEHTGHRSAPLSTRARGWMASLLVIATWLSGAIFGAYILAFYGGAMSDGAMERWNLVLPQLHDADTPAATSGIGLHFLAGGLLLLLGPTQLIAGIRQRWLSMHRWVGRLFVTASLLTAVGGLLFIALKGTIGGAVMDVGFALYGALMALAAVQTIRHARARELDEHRAWAIRLFALVIGSWLYRILYGVWFLAADGVGHTGSFDGFFDRIMAFAFYVPNLAVAELYIRADSSRAPSPALTITAAVVFGLTATIVLVGTYFFTSEYWGPEILARF